jgi:hypothetical protein
LKESFHFSKMSQDAIEMSRVCHLCLLHRGRFALPVRIYTRNRLSAIELQELLDLTRNNLVLISSKLSATSIKKTRWIRDRGWICAVQIQPYKDEGIWVDLCVAKECLILYAENNESDAKEFLPPVEAEATIEEYMISKKKV